MPPVIEIRLTEIGMGLDRPGHPELDEQGLLWVRVEPQLHLEARRGDRRVWLTTPELEELRKAMAKRNELMDSGRWTG